eukprot:6270516-Prymnesium_polylepis.1
MQAERAGETGDNRTAATTTQHQRRGRVRAAGRDTGRTTEGGAKREEKGEGKGGEGGRVVGEGGPRVPVRCSASAPLSHFSTVRTRPGPPHPIV